MASFPHLHHSLAFFVGFLCFISLSLSRSFGRARGLSFLLLGGLAGIPASLYGDLSVTRTLQAQT